MPLPSLEKLMSNITTGSLWDRSSVASSEYQRLWDELVPDSGMAHTTKGEALRAISRLYYDLYNNGGCNSTMPHYYGFALFIGEWCDSLEGECTYRPYSKIKEVIEILDKCREKDDRWSDDHYEDVTYDLSNNSRYTRCLEEIAHWVTWVVAQTTKEE